MRSRFLSAALSVLVLTIAAYGVSGQFPPPTEQFPLWGTCGEKSKNGLTAMTSFQTAWPLVLGPPPAGVCSYLMQWKQALPGERTGTNKGSIFDGVGWPDDPVTFPQAVTFLKSALSQQQPDVGTVLSFWGSTAISNAYLEVYGRTATPAEQAAWEPQVKTQKAWYATIASAEIKKLNANQSQRRSLVNAVYQASMGRNATPADRDYWVPRVEHYRPMVEAARAFLYSPAGSADLEQMIVRSYTVKMGKAPTIDKIKTRMELYPTYKPRPIYSELIK